MDSHVLCNLIDGLKATNCLKCYLCLKFTGKNLPLRSGHAIPLFLQQNTALNYCLKIGAHYRNHAYTATDVHSKKTYGDFFLSVNDHLKNWNTQTRLMTSDQLILLQEKAEKEMADINGQLPEAGKDDSYIRIGCFLTQQRDKIDHLIYKIQEELKQRVGPCASRDR